MTSKTSIPILIIEDNPANQKVLESVCLAMQIEYHMAENGKIAMEFMAETQYNVFVVDLMMPVMDGKTFIQELKKINPNAIILVQTALDVPDTIIDIMKLGVFDYIVKPIDIDLFKQVILKALDYARLKIEEINNLKRFRKEIAKIREIQVSQLPNITLEGFDISCSVLPAEDLSGDFLTGYYLNASEYLLTLCDVAGHGIASSYVGADIRSIFRTESAKYEKISDILSGVNSVLVEEINNTNYLSSALLCTLSVKDYSCSLVSAGHPPAIYFNAKNKKLEFIKPEGTLLGFTTGVTYQEKSFSMEEGDILLLYTDGITEARGGDVMSPGDMFELNRLSEALLECVGEKSNDIILHILHEIYDFTEYMGQEDDMTLVCIKR